MGLRDFYSNTDVRTSIVPGSKNATQTGSAVDVSGALSAMFLVACGTGSGTPVFNLSFDESDDGTTWAPVDAKWLKSDAPTPLTIQWCFRVGYIGKRRYVRPVATWVSGTSLNIGVVCILDPKVKPIA